MKSMRPGDLAEKGRTPLLLLGSPTPRSGSHSRWAPTGDLTRLLSRVGEPGGTKKTWAPRTRSFRTFATLQPEGAVRRCARGFPVPVCRWLRISRCCGFLSPRNMGVRSFSTRIPRLTGGRPGLWVSANCWGSADFARIYGCPRISGGWVSADSLRLPGSGRAFCLRRTWVSADSADLLHPSSVRSAFADTHRKTKPEEMMGHLRTPIFSSSPSAFTPESTPLAQCIQSLPPLHSPLPGGIVPWGTGCAARRGEMGRASKGSLLFSRRCAVGKISRGLPSPRNMGVRSFSTRIPRPTEDGQDCGCLQTFWGSADFLGARGWRTD